MNDSCGTNPQKQCCHKKCISWSAVIVGGLVGVGLGFLLNLLAIAIGLSAFTTTDEGIATFVAGGFAGLAIITIVSMYCAGFVAGSLGQPYCTNRKWGGELYGFIAWCLALIFSMLLTSHTSQFIEYSSSRVNPHVTIVATTSQKVMDTNVKQAKNKQADNKKSHVTIVTDKAVNPLIMAAFATFFLFFVGMLASCFGGHCGMGARKNCDEQSCS